MKLNTTINHNNHDHFVGKKAVIYTVDFEISFVTIIFSSCPPYIDINIDGWRVCATDCIKEMDTGRAVQKWSQNRGLQLRS